uniref:Uncharacterized protein n=1 Tax=Gouania willdenowi TaxID=441366 RepID=A0A8C5HR04_GOUWI
GVSSPTVLNHKTRRKKKRESDRQRAQTRIRLGKEYAGWRELKEKEGCKLDADLAMFMLDTTHLFRYFFVMPGRVCLPSLTLCH